MLKRVRDQFGAVGFVVSIVALVVALAGGAYAASGGLTGKQKKEVKTIAQAAARKVASTAGPSGPQGSQGVAGPRGLPGANGTSGEHGVEGPVGSDGPIGPEGRKGTSVTNIPIPVGGNAEGKCPLGGAQFQVGSGEKTYACNGEGGGGGGGEGYPETLPSGRSEIGFWQVIGESGVVVGGNYATISTISFPLPLATAPAETIVMNPSGNSEEDEEKCPGEVFEPKARAGILCLYVGTAEPVALKEFGALTTVFGAELLFEVSNKAAGAWAVTAE